MFSNCSINNLVAAFSILHVWLGYAIPEYLFEISCKTFEVV